MLSFLPNLTLQSLRDAGLEPDWMTVYLGWRGFEKDYDSLDLAFAEVQDFAYERIGLGSEDENYAALRLIDIATPTIFSLSAEFFLRELAAKSSVTQELARRKYRLTHWEMFRQEIMKVGEGVFTDENELYSWGFSLIRYDQFWRVFVNHPPLPNSLSGEETLYDHENALRQALDDMTQWATQERKAILTEEAET